MGNCTRIKCIISVVLVLLSALYSSEASDISKTSYSFALKLLKELGSEAEQNVIFSPISIETVLAMLQQGAQEDSARQLEKVLHLSKERSKRKYSDLLKSVLTKKSELTLEIANRAFVKKSIDLLPEFTHTLVKDFHSGIDEIDFNPNVDAANHINQWIARATKDKIKDLVSPDALTDDTILILLNAVYFKGLWEKPFEKYQTRNRNFTIAQGKQVEVQSMRHRGQKFNSGENIELGVRWVELPFKGEEYSLLAITPNKHLELQEIIDKMTAEDIVTITNTKTKRRTTLELPKFKISYKTSLQAPLQRLGLTDIFTNAANLKGIAATNKPLYVSDVVHGAELDINEEGGEAAGSTGIFVTTLSLHSDELFIFFEEPFLIFIIDKRNDVPLFIGRVNNPNTI